MSARDELTDFITDLVYKAGVLDALMDHEQAAPIHRRIDSLMSAAAAEVRAEVLREAIDAIQDPKQRRLTSVGSGLGYESALEVLRRMADAAVSGSTAKDERAETCSIPHCDADTGEPCDKHERLAAHAEGEHAFCGSECTEGGAR
jgi:hypothetical protein